MTQAATWLAVDWGTSSLRVWALAADGDVLAYRTSDKGMGTLAVAEFEPALLELTHDLLPDQGKTPVIVCGMAGARQGWAEAPYVATPCPPPGIANATKVAGTDPRLDVRILPGIKQITPPDVMRGEETQIAGFLKTEAGFTGVLCLPGTHTKWAVLEKGSVQSFRTFMTGELFSLISKQSVLKHSVNSQDLDQTAFSSAVQRISAHPQDLTADLFSLRAASLIAGQTPAEARGRLSGFLIGAEVTAMLESLGAGEIVILGDDAISAAYQSALAILGHKARLADARTITLLGLQMAYETYSDTP
ncbi:2-dehydro-3-deoxygalactonokinase [Roseibium sediminis]|uniref:2-dehydro-3-deoxygalactonokinase n=1 Tax=Roseibium sediminis TaxID=1775174 RepID=UPI00123C965D|nr:2-dehydro-3-deoxygalactonokinase [Roseibium sediminis]